MNEIFKSIIQSTHSELILALIVVVVFLIAVSRLMVKDRKERQVQEDNARIERQQQYIKREAQLLEIISRNTEVIAGLKASLDNNGITTSKSFERVHDRIDELFDNQREILKEFAEIRAMLSMRGEI